MTIDKHVAERLREKWAGEAEILGDGLDCPSAEVLWESVAGELDRDRNVAVIRHIGECSACGVAWELARELAPAISAAAPRPEPRRTWLPLAAAAVLLVAVGGVWVLQPWRTDAPAPPYREGARPWLVSEVAPGASLSREDCLLRWSAGPEGTTYDVRVTDANLEPLARAWSLERPEFRIEADALTTLSPGERILWRVTAHLPDGGTVASVTFITPVD